MSRLVLRAAGRLYGWLVRLCPRDSLLDTAEMTTVFEAALKQEQNKKGRSAAIRFCLGAYLDTLVFAATAWTDRLFGKSQPVRTPHREPFTMRWPSFHGAFRFGFRSLSNTPSVTGIAVLTVALAVGLTAVTLSLVYGTTLRPLPFPGGERIQSVELSTVEDDRRVEFEALELRDFRERQTSFEGLEGYFQRRVTLQTDDYAHSFNAGVVTAGALDHLGITPLFGRTFQDGEDFTHAIEHVVLGFEVWQRHLGARRDILGQTVRIDGRELQVVGVMPEGFRFPAREDLWIPMDFDLPLEDRGSGRSFQVFGRLKTHVTPQNAQQEAALIAAGIAEQNPAFHRPMTAEVKPFVQSQLPAGLDPLLRILPAAVLGILLIAAANLINLLLGRAVLRSRDTTIRSALGAGKAEIGALFVAESLLVSLAGAVVGGGLAVLGVARLQQVAGQFALPYWAEIRLDPPVWAATGLGAVLFALTVGILASSPALSRGSIQSLGREMSHRRAGRIGRSLVTAQIAISCALLVGAGLLIKSLTHARSIDLGFQPDRVMTAEVRLPKLEYPDADSRSSFFVDFLDQASSLPGITGAAWVRSPPGTGSTFSWPFHLEGTEPQPSAPTADGVPVSHGYFDVLGIPMLQGRDFLPQESRAGQTPAVIVNRTLAERHFQGSPVGRRLKLSQDPKEPWLTIVGVVEDSYIGTSSGGIGLSTSKREQIFVSWGIAPYSRATLLLGSAVDQPTQATPQARELLASLAPGVSLDNVNHLRRVIDESTWAFGLFGSLFGIFGGVALILSIIGLYGVSAFVLSRRIQEMGVRLALGATRADLRRLMLSSAARSLTIGIGTGWILGYFLAGSVQALLFGVGILDWTVYGLIATTLGITGISAALLSTGRIGRIAPADVLRG